MFNVYICVGIKCVIPCEMKMNFCVWFSIIIIMCGGVGDGSATSDRPGRGAVCANGVEAAAATSWVYILLYRESHASYRNYRIAMRYIHIKLSNAKQNI